MQRVDVVAVVGMCVPERLRYAKRLAALTGREFVPATRLAISADPVDEAATIAPWIETPAGAVLELPHSAPVIELIGALTDPDAGTQLSGIVCVADAARLLEDLQRVDSAPRLPLARERPPFAPRIPHAMLTVTQLEYASTIVVANWSGLSTVIALISHLSPQASLRVRQDAIEPWVPGETFTAGQERPGWIGLLNDDYEPHLTDPRVAAFRYENVRPLHPVRLRRLLDRLETDAFGTVVRSAGFCRFASRPHVVAHWDHVGRMITFDPLSHDDALGDDQELLALGQDLAIIGLDLDTGGLTAALDDAALTDDELATGPTLWARLADPFPL